MPKLRNSDRQERLALLLPGHNEELILAMTIQHAVKAGQAKEDIYVVDDNSSDNTRAVALKELPESNVLSVGRSGKAGAVHKAIRHFNLERRYRWVHVADADSIFCPNYFHIYREAIRPGNCVAAVGFVQSLRGNWIARYRSFSYTYGQHIFRRIQSWFGMISVLPGPVTCFRTDIIKHLDFLNDSVTEDFDLTLQIHRKKLGKIRFIPSAVNFTQDPKTIKDFYKQTLRWQRGFFQGVRQHRIGRHLQKIDFSIGYQLLETIVYLVQLLVVLPFVLFVQHNPKALLYIIIGDATIVCILAVFSAIAARRAAILTVIPYYFPMRFFELAILLIAFVEVIVLRRFKSKTQGWDTEGRRYTIDTEALKDLA